MVLVDGEVIYKVKVSTLIEEEFSQNENKIKEVLGRIGDAELEWFAEQYEIKYNIAPMLINEGYEKYINNSIGLDVKKEILEYNEEVVYNENNK